VPAHSQKILLGWESELLGQRTTTDQARSRERTSGFFYSSLHVDAVVIALKSHHASEGGAVDPVARRKEGPEREGKEGSRRGTRQEILEDPIGRRSRQWRQRRTRVRTTVRIDREGDSKSRWSTGAHPRGRMGAIPSRLTKIQGLFLRRRLPRDVWGPKSWRK
jgi:hypothetical protein